MDSRGTPRRPLPSKLISISIVVAAAILRFNHLGAKSLWLDEGMSVGIARLPWAQFFRLIWQREANMSAYYVLLHYWLKLGSSEAFVRSLSVIFGIGAVAALDGLGSELFDQTTGWVAASLLAFNAWHIVASQQARSYSLAIFALIVSCYFFARLLRSQDARDPEAADSIGYAVVSALAVYSHFYSALVIAAQWIAIPFVHLNANRKSELFRAIRYFAYFVAPLAAFIASRGSSQLGWIAALPRGQFAQLARELTGNGALALEILYAAALAVAAVFTIRTAFSKNRVPELWPALLSWAWLLLPVCAVLAASAVWKPMLFPRYLLIVLPGLALVAARGITAIPARPIVAVITLGAIALSFSALRANRDAYFDFGREDWRAATQYVIAHSLPDDGAIFFTAPARLPFEFYRTRGANDTGPMVISPAHAASSDALDYRDFEPEPLAVTFQSLPENHSRVWLILSPYNPNAERERATLFLMNWCDKRYRLIEERRFEGIDVLLYAKK